jgi:hypothetical protein
MGALREFRIHIPQEAIDDLQKKLQLARWPHPIADDWSRGQPLRLIRSSLNTGAHDSTGVPRKPGSIAIRSSSRRLTARLCTFCT